MVAVKHVANMVDEVLLMKSDQVITETPRPAKWHPPPGGFAKINIDARRIWTFSGS